MVSVLCLWLLLVALQLSGVQQQAVQGRLYDRFRAQLADGTAPLGPAEVGSPVALLASQRAAFDSLVVVEGSASRQTQAGPGHRRSSPLPGQPGVAVLLGRGTTFGAPFARISLLRKGDRLTATTGQGIFVYVVDGVRRSGDPLPAPVAQGGGRLTLISTEPSSWRQGWVPTGTVYVDATLRGKSQLPGAPRPGAVVPSEQVMGVDRTALVPLLLWLQGLLLAACGLAWAFVRWGVWQAWIVGVPVLTALLWGATTAAAQLIPNVI